MLTAKEKSLLAALEPRAASGRRRGCDRRNRRQPRKAPRFACISIPQRAFGSRRSRPPKCG